jgi:SnoaL-like protein
MMIPMEQAKEFGARWVEAWNSHDLERIISHYDAAVEFRSPLISRLLGDAGGTIRGREKLKDYFARGLAAFPSLHFELLQVLSGAGGVVLLYRGVRDVLVAEVMELGDSGLVTRVSVHYSEEM